MESKFSFMESEFEVTTFPWKVENEENPRKLTLFMYICEVVRKPYLEQFKSYHEG